MPEMLTTITSLYTAQHKGTRDAHHYTSVHITHYKYARDAHHYNLTVYSSP